MIEHRIQRDILDRLMHAEDLRFSELKPDGMESNIFMYHLKQLIREKLVLKNKEGYHLAPKGLTYADTLSGRNLRPREQPKLITILALQNPAGQWLLAERKTQPYLGTLMLPSGKQHRGESPSAHATRELLEKTGFEVPLSFRGTADIQIHADTGELLTHVAAFVQHGVTADNDLPPETDRLRYGWYAADTATTYMPATAEVISALEDDGIFSLELSVSCRPAPSLLQ